MTKSVEVQKIVVNAWIKIIILAVALGAVLRIALAAHPLTVASSLSVWQWLVVFVLGAVNDVCVMSVFMLPLQAFWLSSGHWKLGTPQRYIFLGAIALLWIWIKYGWKQLHDFNGGLTDVLGYITIFWFVSFAIRAFVPRVGKYWMRVCTSIFIFVYIFLLIFNFCGEWLFWNEFGVRYNFIAVD